MRAHIDWVPRVDFVLDHPVEAVWPYLFDWNEWMMDKRLEHVSGPKDAPGEQLRVATVKDGKEVNSFLTEIVRVEPEKRVVYRLLLRPDGTFGLADVDRARGHMIFNLYPLDGNRTLLSFESVAEMESSTLGQEEMTAQFDAVEAAGAPHWLEHYVPELERLLKEGS
jgi:uncharacterized protein YndB with AHSA1/START domain